MSTIGLNSTVTEISKETYLPNDDASPDIRLWNGVLYVKNERFNSEWTSASDVTLAVLSIFILSLLATCSNALLVISIYRFKRLRNPSNYLVLSLSTADLGIGLVLPVALYFELCRSKIDRAFFCLLPFSILILLCSVSILSVTGIALDRYISLASPLRYNNIITDRTIGRYVIGFWVYSFLVSSTPMLWWYSTDPDKHVTSCSFNLIGYQVRLFLFFSLFAPCLFFIFSSYAYVYVVARYHARAIFSVEMSFRQQAGNVGTEARYSRTLAVTTGLFLVTWLPFQMCMLIDAFHNTNILSGKVTFYLGVLAVSNICINPWIYGFRNSEIRYAFLRTLEEFAPKLGYILKSSVRAERSYGGVPSYASNIRLCHTPNIAVTTTEFVNSTCLHPPDNIYLTETSFLTPNSSKSVVTTAASV
ncbi:probable G-protein coupled receptor No9 [Limulus polyphemus]|uniref:Probable G-protein coupled receptor No9 n=1 Tax=Limulus polyphemus TaxID=6850 RepID=A0ABM1BTI5_LIMPO|nr:probable G-protein coupled receptor No9 [Limulus polyphemus]